MQRLKNKILGATLAAMLASTATAEIKPEPIGVIEKLPAQYPAHWLMVHDAAFFHMSDGKMVLLDADAETQPTQYQGMLNSSGIGQYNFSVQRKEHYVAQTFWSRGHRGTRTDVISIYDFENLALVGEVELPGGKRSQTMPEKFALQLIDGDRFLLIFNLTPATSVSVVDLEKREVINEVQIPGCALAYPTGKRGFSSMCSDGALLTTLLDKDGQTKSQQRGKPFFNVDEEPMFEKPAMVGGKAYFPSFRGSMQPVGLNGNSPSIKKSWSLVSDEERAAGWRPGGLQLLDSDAKGRIYILMHPEGYNGSHKDGGPEVWVFDPRKKKRLQRIKLKTHGVSLAVTQDKNPILVVTNAEMNLDVYSADNGEYVRTLSDFGQETPFVVYPVQ